MSKIEHLTVIIIIIMITLMMTPCAGRLTPQARVAVQTRTRIWPLAKYFSTRFLSDLGITGGEMIIFDRKWIYHLSMPA